MFIEPLVALIQFVFLLAAVFVLAVVLDALKVVVDLVKRTWEGRRR